MSAAKTTKQGVGRLLLRIVFSILLTFTILGTVGFGIGAYVLHSPTLLLSQIDKQDAAKKVHDALQQKYALAYHTTAVPSEVYMDVLTEEWLETAMKTYVKENYSLNKTSDAIDFTALQESITTYFETYAEENAYAKDETYTEKLEETISDAEKTVNSAIDVFHLHTMYRAGILQKFLNLGTFQVWIGLIGCGVLTAVLLLLLHRMYFVGMGLFAAGVLLTVPSLVVWAGGYISRFALKDAAVYAVFTGTMYHLLYLLLGIGIILFVIGLVLTGIAIVRSRKRETAKA